MLRRHQAAASASRAGVGRQFRDRRRSSAVGGGVGPGALPDHFHRDRIPRLSAHPRRLVREGWGRRYAHGRTARGVLERARHGGNRPRGLHRRLSGMNRRIVLETALLSVAQMTETDRAAIAAGTPGAVLMQNAGNAVVQEITRRWSPRPVTVLCGPGNNGGDGFVVANALAQAGWPVRVALLGVKEELRGDARMHAARWSGGIECGAPDAIGGAALGVDALFGSGLSRPLDPQIVATLSAVTQRGFPPVAVGVAGGGVGGE